MGNFVPDMLVTFQLSPRSDEYFYYDAPEDWTLVRGGYFVGASDESSDLDFTITDPGGEVIMKKAKAESLFYFYTQMAGTYTFIISNHRWIYTKMVTFAMGAGNETTLSTDNLNDIGVHVNHISRMVQDIQSESQILWARSRTHLVSVENTTSRVFWFALIELFCVVVATLFQVYYIKGLVSDKRIL